MIIQTFLAQERGFPVKKCRFLVRNPLSGVRSFRLDQRVPFFHTEAARLGYSNRKGLITDNILADLLVDDG